jgi:hypothetical protein
MKLFSLAALALAAAAQDVSSSEDFCVELEKILGKDCKANRPNCLTVSCDVNLLDVERVRIDLDLYGICLDSDEKNIKFTVVDAGECLMQDYLYASECDAGVLCCLTSAALCSQILTSTTARRLTLIAPDTTASSRFPA